ncbi:MAG TPA: glycosyltransferase [bacterium]|nr:glycosyltransferase [bacterium]
MVSIVIPAYNEASILEKNILQLFAFCQKNILAPWQIIISDNASDDGTSDIAGRLATLYPEIKHLRLAGRGKGLAVISAWQKFPADIYIFMDADLSVDLSALPPLVSAVQSGADIAAGSRFVSGSSVERSFVRRLISNFLRLILKILLGLKVQDAPCGFKAVNHRVVSQIVPRIKNRTWFFDTELIILAERANLAIQEIPVVWQEIKNTNRRSKVGLLRAMIEYLKNIYRLYASRH